MQSALAPAGPAAQDIAELTYVLVAGAAAIFLTVMALLLHGAFTSPREAGAGLWVVGGGIVLPVALLSLLLSYSAGKTSALTAAAPPGAPRIEVVGHQWWWEVRYRTDGGEIVSANEIRVPVGTSVDARVTTADVIHSFWVPALAGKIDMVPGRTHRIALRADRAGEYRGQCAEYCGTQHAQMALLVVAEPAAEFAGWLRTEAAPARAPVTPEETRGHAEFLSRGCGGCHAIRGTEALGRLGPDLTHVGGRRTLGAGMLPNDARALAAWIAGAHILKPGNLMPFYGHLDAETREAIARYLTSLR